MGAPRAPYMAKTDKERLATGFWNRIESNQANGLQQLEIKGILAMLKCLRKPIASTRRAQSFKQPSSR